MKTCFRQFTLAGLVAVALAATPTPLLAQTNKASTARKPSAEKPAAKTDTKPRAIPFRGQLSSIDRVAKTITVGKRTFHITAETKLYKGDKTQPATFADAVPGERVTGSYRKTDDGKLLANSLYFGAKQDKGGAKKEKTK